ncbi:DUF3408 domain-containing protein [Phocaeicola sp.]|uniref:DUF3408 domain-containing protein n=1 Tax=Phocaeicola sp. TaxID=2773926 RepID=UPI003A91845E
MGTNKEKTPSAAMKKLLLQSASKKEQEIQQIGSVAENAATQPPSEKSEEIKEIAPATDTVQEVQPEPVEVELPVQENKKAEESKEGGKKFSEYLEEHKLKNTEVIRVSSETHKRLKQIAMATGLGMHNIANNILDDVLTCYNKEIQAILKKYMNS